MIQPQTVGGWHLALVYLLVWVGAFLGTYLGGAYMAEASTYFESYGLDRPRTLYWKVRGAGRRCAGMPPAQEQSIIDGCQCALLAPQQYST